MTDDATLSDFLSTETEASEETRADEESGPSEIDGESGSERERENVGEREPADESDGTDETGLSTYGWGEYTCRRCESETDRVWREDGTLVCPNCKSW